MKDVVIYQHDDIIQRKFDALVEKLRSSEITFRWVEQIRRRFEVGDELWDYMLETSNVTIALKDGTDPCYEGSKILYDGSNTIYSIARVSHYHVTNRLHDMGRIYHDDRTSYYLYNVTSKEQRIEIASNIGSSEYCLTKSQVETLINRIHHTKITDEIHEEHKQNAVETYDSVEDYLDEILMYDG